MEDGVGPELLAPVLLADIVFVEVCEAALVSEPF